MRISDWSSDVCSSDLRFGDERTAPAPRAKGADRRQREHFRFERQDRSVGGQIIGGRSRGRRDEHPVAGQFLQHRLFVDHHLELRRLARFAQQRDFVDRSEEHTSELQSLMRISYAVFCLKKKKYTDMINIRTHEFTKT